MSTNYPGSLDDGTSLPNPSANSARNSPSLAGGQDNQNAAIIAVESKVGTGASTPTNNNFLVGTGTGTSAWTKAVPTGAVVGTSDSQTLTNKTLTSPTINTATINNPTLKTDTVAGFSVSTNGTVYGVSVTGGVITSASVNSAAIVSNAVTTAKLATGASFLPRTVEKNPYKFLVTQTAAANTGNSAFATIAFDTEIYDTGSNIAAGIFTAPATGFYAFTWSISATLPGAGTVIASIFKNGTSTEICRGSRPYANSAQIIGSTGSVILSLSSSDTIRCMAYGTGTGALDVGSSNYNSFSGWLVSAT